jgi:hypothetical protein
VSSASREIKAAATVEWSLCSIRPTAKPYRVLSCASIMCCETVAPQYNNSARGSHALSMKKLEASLSFGRLLGRDAMDLQHEQPQQTRSTRHSAQMQHCL